MRNNTVTKFTLGRFYNYGGTFCIYRYVGNYGKRKVFEVYGYDCTDSTGIWYYRSQNRLWVLGWLSYSGLNEVKIDKNGRFTLYKDIVCELLHDYGEFQVLTEGL